MTDRLLGVGSFVSAAVLPVVRSVSRDKSWRVRYVVAEHFCALVERLGVDVTRVEMVPTYVALLQDNEAEVRTAAAFNSTSFAAMLLAETVLTHLLPCYRELSSDSSPHVRGFEPANPRAAPIDTRCFFFLPIGTCSGGLRDSRAGTYCGTRDDH